MQEIKFFFIACKHAQERFSVCQRAQNGVTGYSVHLYSDKARCFNQSERASYRNFIIIENTSSLWAETIREKKNNEKAAIKVAHKDASQTGNCGSVLVCNVSKGTLELKTKRLEIISPSNTASCLLQWLLENFVDAESKFSSHLTKLFLARATSRADL